MAGSDSAPFSGLGDLQSVDAQLLAAGGDILSSQHGGVRGRLVTVGLDLHTASDTGNGLAATGITQNVSLSRTIRLFSLIPSLFPGDVCNPCMLMRRT